MNYLKLKRTNTILSIVNDQSSRWVKQDATEMPLNVRANYDKGNDKVMVIDVVH